jgi:DNA-binding FadR family transcriptional regulator
MAVDDETTGDASPDPAISDAPKAETFNAGGGHSPRKPLGELVYRMLLTEISHGDYEPDKKLPGENELATRFQVSRPIVRAGLKRLRDEGLIYSRQGAGNFVKMRVEGAKTIAFSPVGTIVDIQRCYEFRISIEPDHAYVASLRWNEEALHVVATALDLMRDATHAHRHREDADYAFHLAVAQATNNHYYVSSMLALKDHIAVGMKFHGVSLLGPDSGLAKVFDEHEAIFEAIRRRDGDAAKHLMRRHLEASRDRIFEGRTLDLAL